MTWDPPGLWASLILSISGGIVAGILVLVGSGGRSGLFPLILRQNVTGA